MFNTIVGAGAGAGAVGAGAAMRCGRQYTWKLIAVHLPYQIASIFGAVYLAAD
jgi:hypothetical protein